MQYKHQEFQFPLLNAVHCGTESEHQVLNDSHIFVSFTRILLLFGTEFQYSCKGRQDEEGKQSDKAAIRDLVLTFCPTMRSVQQRKLKLLMLVYPWFLRKGENRSARRKNLCGLGNQWCPAFLGSS